MSKTPTTAKGKLATTLSLIGLLFFFSASARVASAQDAPPNGADNNQAPADQSPAPGDQAQPPSSQGSDQGMSNGQQNAPNIPQITPQPMIRPTPLPTKMILPAKPRASASSKVPSRCSPVAKATGATRKEIVP